MKQKYISEKTEKVVPRAEMVKGYEVEKDHFVLFSQDELKTLEKASSDVVDIVAFIPEKTVHPLYYDKAYLLARDNGIPRDAMTGQMVMDFTFVAGEDGSLAVQDLVAQVRPSDGGKATKLTAQDCLARDDALEADDREGGRAAYRQAIALDPSLVAAYVSLGAMLCEGVACPDALLVFDEALAHGASDALLHFNHAIALEDTGQAASAMASFGAVLQLDPQFADAHFNWRGCCRQTAMQRVRCGTGVPIGESSAPSKHTKISSQRPKPARSRHAPSCVDG